MGRTKDMAIDLNNQQEYILQIIQDFTELQRLCIEIAETSQIHKPKKENNESRTETK